MKKPGRPSHAAMAAQSAADDAFRASLVRQAYDRPMDTLGNSTFRELARNQSKADEALTKANVALVDCPVLNRIGLASHIAALTRTAELARAYPEELRVQSAKAHARLLAAKVELQAANAEAVAADAAEVTWLEWQTTTRTAVTQPKDKEGTQTP